MPKKGNSAQKIGQIRNFSRCFYQIKVDYEGSSKSLWPNIEITTIAVVFLYYF